MTKGSTGSTLPAMAKYKLTYFDFSGSRGEECRLALHLAGVDFEDNRLPRGAWAELKPKSPFGSLPTLEKAGSPQLAQSSAILSYVGRAHGLLPADPWEAARHESILAYAEELRILAGPTGQAKDEEEKKKKREEFAAGPMQEWGARLERLVVGPFVGGEAISVADVKIYQVMHAYYEGVLDYVPKTVFQSFPKLEALYRAVKQHPKIVEWKSRH